MALEFLDWNFPPLDFSRIPVTVILINMIVIIIILNNTTARLKQIV